MFCSNCGAAEQQGSFCNSCGSPVNGATSSQSLHAAANSNGLAIGGLLLGIAAFFFLPIILGPLGLILGIIAKSQGQRSAVAAIVTSSIGTVVGLIFGAMVGLSFFA